MRYYELHNIYKVIGYNRHPSGEYEGDEIEAGIAGFD